MRLLVLLWGCLVLPGYEALKGPKEISGFEGDTVSLKCTYGEELRDHRKYWCREVGLFISRCAGTIYSGEEGQEITEGRVSIRDSRQELSFTVTLQDLTLKDAGKYWCGVKKLGVDEFIPITLTIFAGSSRPIMYLDSTSAEDASPALSSGSSKPRLSIPLVRILAPVLVLLSLLGAAGLITFSSHLLRWRKEAQLATETQRNEKVYLSHLNHRTSELGPEEAFEISSPTFQFEANPLSEHPGVRAPALAEPSKGGVQGLGSRDWQCYKL
ncbi:CMRF35-like molecule 9 isoform X3 [Callithrix jacchus]|uniref:CMRF35-like molecule 9 isoform X3 n=1 Tax=Callithrix jacchus TaxID=9483 RepID=UPI0008403937|nr:CMRF35-like molecule 9 isoform X3 [Callithrix jacchus]